MKHEPYTNKIKWEPFEIKLKNDLVCIKQNKTRAELNFRKKKTSPLKITKKYHPRLYKRKHK